MRRLAILVPLLASACAYNQLSARGSRVETLPSAPGADCQNLGIVIGKGGGAFGLWVANEELMEYALNDARNKAAELGATSVVVTPPQLGVSTGEGGGVTTATVMAIAYRCAGAVAMEKAAPAVATVEAEAPHPSGFRAARVRIRTALRAGPDPQAPPIAWLDPGAQVSASEADVRGFRRVTAAGGTTGFTEVAALDFGN